MPAIIKTIIIREESTPIKTVVVNRGPRGVPGSLESYTAVTQTFTLTAQNMTDKKVTLSSMPANNNITLVPEGGFAQAIGVHYEVINQNEVSWNGLGLDGFLEEGEQIYITYQVRI